MWQVFVTVKVVKDSSSAIGVVNVGDTMGVRDWFDIVMLVAYCQPPIPGPPGPPGPY